ncbi:MAG: OsmC family peroxiredoxin, partial [Bacteroidota bacterium]|nr:OsmC family peroxiredoxin [Bacteroidota bacterium]
MKADPRRIGGIELNFHFPDSLQITEKDRLILERAGNTCPVRYSIHPDIEVLIHYNWPAPITA